MLRDLCVDITYQFLPLDCGLLGRMHVIYLSCYLLCTTAPGRKGARSVYFGRTDMWIRIQEKQEHKKMMGKRRETFCRMPSVYWALRRFTYTASCREKHEFQTYLQLTNVHPTSCTWMRLGRRSRAYWNLYDGVLSLPSDLIFHCSSLWVFFTAINRIFSPLFSYVPRSPLILCWEFCCTYYFLCSEFLPFLYNSAHMPLPPSSLLWLSQPGLDALLW